MKTIESDIQIACVKWFRYQYPEYVGVFFAVPNGGKRNARTAEYLKLEGVLAGVSDLILLVARGEYHGLCIEMKAPKGVQQPTQKEFQKAVESQGYRYVICRSFQEFETEIKTYLQTK